MTLDARPSAPPAILLCGEGGASAADLAFLQPMLARRGAVSTVHPEQLDGLQILPNTTLVAFGDHGMGALRAAQNSAGLIARVVLIDAELDHTAPTTEAFPVLMIAEGPGFTDVRRVLHERPARF